MGKFLCRRLCCWDKLQSFAWLTFLDYLKSFVFKTMLSCRVSLPLTRKGWGGGGSGAGADCDPETTSGCQLKPSPAPLGLCVARIGSVMPRPSGPRPMPGLQPMLCSIRLPMFVSGMGGALSPTNPEKKEEHEEGTRYISPLSTFVLMRIKPGPAQRTKARDVITLLTPLIYV